jgi:hypothetical protein
VRKERYPFKAPNKMPSVSSTYLMLRIAGNRSYLMIQPRLNWAMKKYRSAIELLPLEYPKDFLHLLAEKGIPINSSRTGSPTLIDWEVVSPHYTIPYFEEDSEVVIRQTLGDSVLAKCASVVMEFGYDWPTVRILTSKFILHWHDFAFSAELGAVVVADSQPLFLEFSNDGAHILHCNFELPR